MLVGYARGSKPDSQGITSQIEALNAVGCEQIFEEAASGGRWDRPQLKLMIDQLRPDDTVVVWKIDRLTGSLKDLLYILEKIDQKGAFLRSIVEPFDTSGPAGRMLMQMLSGLINFEREKVRERTREGQLAARARGNGGGRTPKLSPTQRREILEMLAAGRSAADLARLFRVHRATISRVVDKAARSTPSTNVEVP